MTTEPKDAPRSSWLADRLGWDRLRSSLDRHAVPRHSFFFYIGGLTLFALLLQVASGILLMMYYRPDAAAAHASVERIAREIPYGGLVRGVHVWAADLFVAMLLLHAFIVMVRRSFKSPQELGWLSGVLLMLIGIGQAFTGAVLPWSERAYTNARVGSQLAGYTPMVGDWFRRFLRGGEELSTDTLSRAYAFHVALLPAAMTVVVAGHFYFISRKPVVALEESNTKTIPFYPDFLIRQGVAFVGILVLVLTLAIFADRSIGTVADPRLATPADAQPPWYMLALHYVVRTAPRELLGVEGPRFLGGAVTALGVLFAALPFVDRRGSRITVWLSWVGLFALLLLSFRALH
jgi:quinol-cytochrome oxidoreductase complex cytochrome b subunit